jgi:hypothetical protein
MLYALSIVLQLAAIYTVYGKTSINDAKVTIFLLRTCDEVFSRSYATFLFCSV